MLLFRNVIENDVCANKDHDSAIYTAALRLPVHTYTHTYTHTYAYAYI